MTSSAAHTICLFFLSFVVLLQRPIVCVAATPACSTDQCHSGLSTHPDKKECSTCHKEIAQSASHPQPGRKTFTTDNTPCLDCHQKVTAEARLHPPVAAGDCKVCHSPHAKDTTTLLKKSGLELCNECHLPVLTGEEPFLHGDIKTGGCLACHLPHGSPYPQLLKDNYSTAYYNDYDSNHYKLCFRCHKIDLLLYPKTSYNTDFRDGKNNLHFIHVNKQLKGLACKNCHVTHAGFKEKLMMDAVRFGTWQMPINFSTTANGGSCAPGCHTPESYDRRLVHRKL